MAQVGRAFLFLSALLFVLAASRGSAQYMFLDANGDGACDESDRLNSLVSGVDLWIDTNHNADGTEVSCGAEPLELHGYYFVLRYDDVAHNNSWIRFGALTNLQPAFPIVSWPGGFAADV